MMAIVHLIDFVICVVV